MLKTNLLKIDECREIIECKDDLSYFCNKYIFKLMNYQERLFDKIQSEDNLIFSKFRGGGFTTQMHIYSLWLSLFGCENTTILIADKAAEQDKMISSLSSKLPGYLAGKSHVVNGSRVYLDTNSSIIYEHYDSFLNDICNRHLMGRKTNQLTIIIDEFSFLNRFYSKNEENKILKYLDYIEKLRGICKTKFIVFGNLISCDDFYDALQDAKNGLNNFSTYNCDVNEFLEQIDSSSKDTAEKERVRNIIQSQYQNPNWSLDYGQMLPDLKNHRSIYDDFIPSFPFTD